MLKKLWQCCCWLVLPVEVFLLLFLEKLKMDIQLQLPDEIQALSVNTG
jgi:hypothetical protein